MNEAGDVVDTTTEGMGHHIFKVLKRTFNGKLICFRAIFITTLTLLYSLML